MQGRYQKVIKFDAVNTPHATEPWDCWGGTALGMRTLGGEKLPKPGKPKPTPPPPPKPPPKPKRKNSRLPSPLTPEFKTARSTGNLVGTPKFETKSGRKKKRHRKIVIVEEDIVPYEITHGMKLSKLNFRLREKKKDHGYCWVSSVRDIAGVSDNDWLVEVNHQSTKGMGVKDVIAILRKTSKPFTLGFYRNKKK